MKCMATQNCKYVKVTCLQPITRLCTQICKRNFVFLASDTEIEILQTSQTGKTRNLWKACKKQTVQHHVHFSCKPCCNLHKLCTYVNVTGYQDIETLFLSLLFRFIFAHQWFSMEFAFIGMAGLICIVWKGWVAWNLMEWWLIKKMRY